MIRRELFERAKDFNIILDDVAITELSFSREYTAAVEAKQVGEEAHAHTLAIAYIVQLLFTRTLWDFSNTKNYILVFEKLNWVPTVFVYS